MDKLAVLISLAFILTSCAGPATSAAPPLSTSTSASLPSATPTFTPTITPTPTETPDPNRPSDATGRDATTGEYTKTVEKNSKSLVYVWKQFQFGDDAKNGITGHWFESRMSNGPINLTEYDEVCIDKWGRAFALNMNVYAVEGQADLNKIGYIFHPDRALEWNKYDGVSSGGLSCTSVSLPDSIMFYLFLRHLDLLSGEPGDQNFLKVNDYYYPGGKRTWEAAQRYSRDVQAFMDSLNQGATIKVGDDLWVPQRGYDVYWIDEAMAENDPSMLLSEQAGHTKNWYWKVMVKDGKLIAFIAPATWLKGQLAQAKIAGRQNIFRQVMLFPLEVAIVGLTTNENPSFLAFNDFGPKSGVLSGSTNGNTFHVDIPFIDFTADK